MKTITVRDVMRHSVASLKESDSVKLGKLSMEVAEVRHMPVVDTAGSIVGVVALGDVVEALASAGELDVAVHAIMKRPVVTIHESALAADAVRTMLENRIGSLPVLGPGDKLVGIVTQTDFLRIAETALRSRELAEGTA